MNKNNFNFFIPVNIEFGRGVITKIRTIIPDIFKKILIVTDPGSFSLSGAEKIIMELLSVRTIRIFDKVEENPSFENIEEGRKYSGKWEPDIILGVGGGSAMDAAKGIAVLYGNSGKISEYVNGTPVLNNPLPVCCIPTTSGTGSEVTPFAVFSDKKNDNKCGFSHPGIFAKTAIVDPSLTDSMPELLRINTGLDVLTHAIEAYLSTEANKLNDIIALHAIDLVLSNLKRAITKEAEAIDEMSYASMLAGVSIAHASTILLHIMAYPLTVFYNIPHGRANAVLLPAFMDFMTNHSTSKSKVSTIIDKFNKYGGIKNFLSTFKVNTKLSTYGVKPDDIEKFADKTINKGDVKITPARITKDIIKQIYNSTFNN